MSDSEQYQRLRCMRNVAIPTMVISVVCIGVGVATIIKSRPHYHFPICLGGGIVAGFSTLLAAYWNIKLYRMYVSSGGNPDDYCWRIQMIFIGTFFLLATIGGLGISGIWCMVDITDAIKAPELFPTEENAERAECGKQMLGYGIVTLVLVLILSILKCIAYCNCSMYFDDEYGVNSHHYRHAASSTMREAARNRDSSSSSRRAVSDELRNVIRNHQSFVPRTTQPQSTTFGRMETDNTDSPGSYSPYSNRRTPTAPSHERVPTAPSRDSVDSFQHIDINDADNRRGRSAAPPPNSVPPPQYADVCDSTPDEPPPPSYEDVLEHGAYRVFHV